MNIKGEKGTVNGKLMLGITLTGKVHSHCGLCTSFVFGCDENFQLNDI